MISFHRNPLFLAALILFNNNNSNNAVLANNDTSTIVNNSTTTTTTNTTTNTTTTTTTDIDNAGVPAAPTPTTIDECSSRNTDTNSKQPSHFSLSTFQRMVEIEIATKPKQKCSALETQIMERVISQSLAGVFGSTIRSTHEICRTPTKHRLSSDEYWQMLDVGFHARELQDLVLELIHEGGGADIRADFPYNDAIFTSVSTFSLCVEDTKTTTTTTTTTTDTDDKNNRKKKRRNRKKNKKNNNNSNHDEPTSLSSIGNDENDAAVAMLAESKKVDLEEALKLQIIPLLDLFLDDGDTSCLVAGPKIRVEIMSPEYDADSDNHDESESERDGDGNSTTTTNTTKTTSMMICPSTTTKA